MIGVNNILGNCEVNVERIMADPDLFMTKFKNIHFPIDQARVHTEKMLEESLRNAAQNQLQFGNITPSLGHNLKAVSYTHLTLPTKRIV